MNLYRTKFKGLYLKNAMGHCIHIKPSWRFLFLKEKKTNSIRCVSANQFLIEVQWKETNMKQGGEDKKNHKEKQKIEKLFQGAPYGRPLRPPVPNGGNTPTAPKAAAAAAAAANCGCGRR